jgi:hypothetical protein
VLRVDDQLDLSAIALIAKSPPEKPALQRHDAAPAIALGARDGFVAETALKIDQLQASVRLLTRDIGQLSGKVAELQETAAQEDRSYAYQQTEKRSRDAKLDEMVRSFRDLKARLDRMEARSSGDYHAYNSFEAVSRKLAEIERAQETSKPSGRGNMIRACLLAVAMLAAAAIIGLSLVLSAGSV